MNDYAKKVMICLDEKLINYAMEHGKSLINIDILYHYHIGEIKTLFYNPQEHYSKIMVLAYNKTIKQYEEHKQLIM